MPGVPRVLGKAGLAVGLGLVLIGPVIQSADAVLPAPAKIAAGHRSQAGADLKPGSTRAIVTHPARTRTVRTKPRSPAKAHPRKHPKAPAKNPATKLPARARMNPVIRHRRRPSLAGSWSLFGGEFRFGRTGVRTITDTVISQRIGVFCPKVNDQDGQLVLRQIDKFDYIGTWQWFDAKTCKSAGYGTVRVMVWRNKEIAMFTAYPPPGQSGPPDTTRMERLP